MTKKRWEEISACQHDWSDYYDSGNCATPYCEWHETRCRKCGIYWREMKRLRKRAAAESRTPVAFRV